MMMMILENRCHAIRSMRIRYRQRWLNKNAGAASRKRIMNNFLVEYDIVVDVYDHDRNSCLRPIELVLKITITFIIEIA